MDLSCGPPRNEASTTRGHLRFLSFHDSIQDRGSTAGIETHAHATRCTGEEIAYSYPRGRKPPSLHSSFVIEKQFVLRPLENSQKGVRDHTLSLQHQPRGVSHHIAQHYPLDSSRSIGIHRMSQLEGSCAARHSFGAGSQSSAVASCVETVRDLYAGAI